jgi:hypothetical protein
MSSWLCHTPMAAVSVALTILVGCAGTQPSRFYEPIPLKSFPCYSALNSVRRAPWPEHSKD